MNNLPMASPLRLLGFVFAALGVALFTILGFGRFGDRDAVAYPTTQTTATDNSGPSYFLPAPNPTPLCDSQDYFAPWVLNQEYAGTPVTNRARVVQDFAYTSDDQTGLVARFDTITDSSSNPAAPVSPEVFGGPGSSIGIVMYEPAVASVTLSEPMFYSQWVFTDLDQPNEGFEVSPQWLAGNTGELGIYFPTAAWNFDGSSNTKADFNTLQRGNTQGYDLHGRAQVDFWGPITGFTIERTGLGGSGFTGGAGCAPLGLAKAASEPRWDAAAEAFVVDYTVRVHNNLPSTETLRALVAASQAAAGAYFASGDPAGIDITNLQLTDSLSLDGFSGSSVSNLTSDTFAVNPNFDGVSDTSLLAGAETLPADTTGTVSFSVTYTPDFADPSWSGCSVTIGNQAFGSGTAAGVDVSDESDAGTDPSPAAQNVAGTSNDDPTEINFSVVCDIALTKSVTNGPVNNGDGTYNVEYTLVAENTGTAPLTSVEIDDDLANTFGSALVSNTEVRNTCAAGPLVPGATCEKVLAVVIEPTDTFSWQNAGSVSAVAPGGDVVSDDSTADAEVVEEPAITLDKTASAGPDASADGTYTVEYTLVAQNTGTTVLTEVTITDDLVAVYGDYLVSSTVVSDTCVGASLKASVPPGSGETCSQVIRVVFGPGADLGPYDNTAEVSAKSPGGILVSANSDESVTAPPTSPAIELVKSVRTGELEVGVLVTYTFEVTNTGDVDLHDVVLVDDLLEDETCPKTTLAVGESMTCIGTYIITQADVDAGRVDNNATVSGTSPSGDEVNDADDATYPVEQSPELTVDKHDAVGAVVVGNEISYPITVTNTGNTTLTSLKVVDSLSEDLSCDVDILEPGQSAQCVALYTVTQADIDACEIINVATAAAAKPDGATVSADDTVRTPTNCTPGISVDKKAIDVSQVRVGDTINYEIVVTNTGTTTLTSVAIDDPLTTDEVCPKDVLAPGEAMICTASYVVTQADIDAGTITNVVKATGVDPKGQTVEDVDDEKVPSEHIPRIEIDKQPPSGALLAGETLTYPIVVTNTGTVTLSNLVVADSLSTHVVCDVTALAPGAVAHCTATYVVSPNDLKAGRVVNTATATAVDPDGEVVTDQDEEIVVLPPSVPPKEIVVVKPTPVITAKPPLALTGTNPKPLAYGASGLVLLGVTLVAVGGRRRET